MFELLGISGSEYPAPIIPFDSVNLNETEYETIVQHLRYQVEDAAKLAIPCKTVFTKIPSNSIVFSSGTHLSMSTLMLFR